MKHRLIALTCGLAEVRSSNEQNGNEAKDANNDSPYVQLIHQSVYDFLVGKEGLHILTSSETNTLNLITRSYQQLSLMCIDFVTSFFNDELSNSIIPGRDSYTGGKSTIPFLQHAAENWINYTAEAESTGSPDESYIAELLEHLEWPDCALLNK